MVRVHGNIRNREGFRGPRVLLPTSLNIGSILSTPVESWKASAAFDRTLPLPHSPEKECRALPRVCYEELLPHEILDRRADFPAAFVGLGVLEWHGWHAATGLDGIEAGAICELAARRGGMAFPTMWYGEPRLAGTLESAYDPDGTVSAAMRWERFKLTPGHWATTARRQTALYERLILHMLLQLDSLGMQAICLFAGHTPLRALAAPAVDRFNARRGGAHAFVGTESDYWPTDPLPVDHPLRRLPWHAAPARETGDDGRRDSWYSTDVGEDHAGYWETSYLMHLRSRSVDMDLSPETGNRRLGVFGIDPAHASAEVGQVACEYIAEGLHIRAAKLLEEVGVDVRFER
jgi:hypothetical protein